MPKRKSGYKRDRMIGDEKISNSDRHGRQTVRPLRKEDYGKMVRLCLKRRDEHFSDEARYRIWYRNYIMLVLGVNTGCRITTLLELMPVDIAGGMIIVRESKTGKRQQYEMNKDVYAVVQRYIDTFNIGKTEFLFKSKDSDDAIVRTTAYHIIKELAEACGVKYDVGCHSLRKSYARWYWDQTHNLLATQALLQHDDPETTMKYIMLEPNDIQEVRRSIRNLTDYE